MFSPISNLQRVSPWYHFVHHKMMCYNFGTILRYVDLLHALNLHHVRTYIANLHISLTGFHTCTCTIKLIWGGRLHSWVNRHLTNSAGHWYHSVQRITLPIYWRGEGQRDCLKIRGQRSVQFFEANHQSWSWGTSKERATWYKLWCLAASASKIHPYIASSIYAGQCFFTRSAQ